MLYTLFNQIRPGFEAQVYVGQLLSHNKVSAKVGRKSVLSE